MRQGVRPHILLSFCFFVRWLQAEVTDFKRAHPTAALETLQTLLRMCNGVLANPESKAPRQVRWWGG